MTPQELGAMGAAEMVVAHAPGLAARTIFRHQRDCGAQLRRLWDALAEIADLDDTEEMRAVARAAIGVGGVGDAES